MVSWKAGSRQGGVWWETGVVLGRLLGRKGSPKGAFLKNMKIENGTKQVVITVRHWDPLKTVLGSGFENTWNIDEKLNGKSMVFDDQNHWQVLKNKHFSWFSVIHKNNETTMPKGTSKVMFGYQNCDMVFPGSTYPLIFVVLVRCQQIMVGFPLFGIPRGNVGYTFRADPFLSPGRVLLTSS